jgi:hypothetical protein
LALTIHLTDMAQFIRLPEFQQAHMIKRRI